jgi:hypothetical protein
VVAGGTGSFFLTWNSYPGALCYSVYQSTDPNDPFGTYVVIMECIPNTTVDLTIFGPGYFRISAITPDGETPLSMPVLVGGGGGFACPTITGPPPSFDVDAAEGDADVVLGPFVVDEGFGAGIVNYEWFKDGVFYLDTTDTSKAFLQFDVVELTDEGDYTLHLSNDQPACALISDPITLTVSSEGSPCFPVTANWWAFESIVGIGFADTLYGHLLNMTGTGVVTLTTGKIGQAVRMSGIGGTSDRPVLQTPVGNSAGPMSMTNGVSVAFWVRLDAGLTDVNARIQLVNMNFLDSLNNPLGNIFLTYDGQLQQFLFGSLGAKSFALVPGVWTHIHFFYDPGASKTGLQINGGTPTLCVGTVSIVGTVAKTNNSITLNLGAIPLTVTSTVSLDEYAIFDRVLTPGQFAVVYNGGSGIACPFPAQPTSLSISGFDASLFTACGGEPASGNPAWDGTFALLNPMDWENTTSPSFKGQAATFIAIAYDDGSSFPLPNPTGCGYYLEIFLSTADSWFGYKANGLSPLGVYTRDPSSCSPGPATLEIV